MEACEAYAALQQPSIAAQLPLQASQEQTTQDTIAKAIVFFKVLTTPRISSLWSL